MLQSVRASRALIFATLLGSAGSAQAQLVGPSGPQPPLPAPPSYGAYVLGETTLSSGPTEIFQQGVLPNASYIGQTPVNLVSGAGAGMTAFADVASGDITIAAQSAVVTPSVLNPAPQPGTFVIALVYSLVTFHGNGSGVLEVEGTLSETGNARADEYSTVSPSVLLPWGAYSDASKLTAVAGNWTSEYGFGYTDGEQAYVVIQLTAQTAGGSLSVADPATLTLSPGTSFTAAAPTFLTGSPAPEPGAWGLLQIGLGGLGGALRLSRRRRPSLAQPA
jgi:hypothetical protein